MVWQPTMRVWAGDEVKVDAKELEDGDAMQGIESTSLPVTEAGPSITTPPEAPAPDAVPSVSGNADVKNGNEAAEQKEAKA